MNKPYHSGRFSPAKPAPNYQRYELEKYYWKLGHPEATPAQYVAACMEIAKRLGV